ncbi:hypothetical protein V1525DRAFT_432485 [Lipomyces kononenkoae]|uniref:Uncharacterized protein n=1 Tax=Lipomyces kononenkoae TaxID=34357 RepID=A0ACC3T1G4_LIPKO
MILRRLAHRRLALNLVAHQRMGIRGRRSESTLPPAPKPFGSSQLWPVAKVFLYGSLVYMLLHWVWWKLESDELYDRLSGRVKELEEELAHTVEERNRKLLAQLHTAPTEENKNSRKSTLKKLWPWR